MLARILFCFLMLAAASQSVNACNVPVFRYALERWPAEPFEVLLFYRGTLEPVQKALADSLAQGRSANLEVTLLDLETHLSPDWQKLWQKQTNAVLPWTIILPPHGDEEPLPLWSGRLDSNIVAQLIDSPARRELAQRLLHGESAVWLLLETGDRRVDDPVAELLARELPTQEKAITLPAPDPDDPKMHAPLPVRVAFSMLRVSRHDPAETWLVKMLLHGESQSAATPIVFPIFGRGRAIAALSGAELTPKIIQDAARFICGACSCEVKELNPGKDLLLAANWNSIFDSATETNRPLRAPVIPAGAFVSSQSAEPGMLYRLMAVAISKPSLFGVGVVAAALLVLITGFLAFARKQPK